VAEHLLVTAAALVGPIALTHGLARGFSLFGSVPTAASLPGTLVVLTALAVLGRIGSRPKPRRVGISS
jgi:hypothetical protein